MCAPARAAEPELNVPFYGEKYGGADKHKQSTQSTRTVPLFYKYFPFCEVNIVSGHLTVGAEKLPVMLSASFVSGR
jgi:hypothetical protein